MLKFALASVQALIGIYWAGEIARQNKDFNTIVTIIEERFSGVSEYVRDASVRSILMRIQNVSGISSILMYIMLLAMYIITSIMKLKVSENVLYPVYLTMFVIATVSIFLYISIAAVFNRKKAIRYALIIFALCVIGAFCLAFFDNEKSLDITKQPYFLLDSFKQQIDCFMKTHIKNDKLISFLSIAISWLSIGTTIFIVAPFLLFITLFSIIFAPILLSKFINHMWPKSNFFGFTVVIYFVISAILVQL